VNFHRDTHVFVNLRCMQVLEKSAILYAGAGVTLDSVPEQEWIETEMKFNTLLSVVHS
jgi:isochorismate synthase